MLMCPTVAQRSFKLSDDLSARLVAEARRLDRPVSWVIQRALEQALGASGAGVPPSPGPAPARAPLKVRDVPAEELARPGQRKKQTSTPEEDLWARQQKLNQGKYGR